MSKYLIAASLTQDGVKGTLAEGGSARRAVVTRLFESIGGTVEAYYYAFGDDDVVVLVDAPDHVTAAAASMTVAAAGVGRVRTTVLISPEEMDEVAKKSPLFRPAES